MVRVHCGIILLVLTYHISFSDKVTLRDLKGCKLAPIVINTFMNLEKYLEYEQRDPVLAAAAKVMGPNTCICCMCVWAYVGCMCGVHVCVGMHVLVYCNVKCDERADTLSISLVQDEGADASLSDWERYAAQQYDRLLSEEEYAQEK